MRRRLIGGLAAISLSAGLARAVMPPSTSMQQTSDQTASPLTEETRFQVIPLQTLVKVDRVTGEVWVLQTDANSKETKWVEYRKEQPGWSNYPR
jgi:hypothetical protein